MTRVERPFPALLQDSGVEHQLRVACRKASERHPSLATRRVPPHTLRHTTAMHLLQSGVDITVIALWLGHEDTATTHQYVEADLCRTTTRPRRLRGRSGAIARWSVLMRRFRMMPGSR